MKTVQVMEHFSSAATTYDDCAALQCRVAALLAQDLPQLPEGEVLEIGCGTGLFTNHLCRRYPDRWLTISDLSPAMISRCWSKLYQSLPARARFQVLDGQGINADRRCALIAGSLVFQWYEHPLIGLTQAYRALKPGGWLVGAVPVEGSFVEWHNVCQRLDLPFTGLPLLSAEQIAHHFGVIPEVVTVTDHHPSALAFFRSLKAIGAHASARSLGYRLLQLVRRWEGPVEVTYRILLLRVERP
jgi:malonyl-CoA O-methyltransferase